jgi:aspartokinase-like uncharacterized kinase
MWVVKLGGSLYQKDELTHWIEQLSFLSQQHPIIIVPGGGPFADHVRQAQQHYSFSDQHAHHMALLAMAQFGLTLLGLSEKCHPLYYPSSLPRKQYPLSVWLPDKSLLTETDIPQNWQVTSDSLALWLAHNLKADKLLLVKQTKLCQPSSLCQLSEQGIIDVAFPILYQQHPVPSYLTHASEHDTIQSTLSLSALTL